MPPIPDVGLDAVQVQPGDVLFSLNDPIFSQRLGRLLQTGDLLSSTGTVVRSNAELLARFQPDPPDKDYGLDALYVWSSGEVWFSTEAGFQGAAGAVLPGDLLSDQGYVVFRNLELVRWFSPLEDLADFGLTALVVVTDVDAGVLPGAPPRIASVEFDPVAGTLFLRGSGSGRAFRLEQADGVQGPYGLEGPIVPEVEWRVPLGSAPKGAGFFRLRSW
jgi:hypothetical protein